MGYSTASACHYIFGCLLALLLSGCTAMKLVPDNRVLYTGSDIDLIPQGRVRAKKQIKELLDANILPKPNTTILGMRPGLWFFYKAGNPEKKGLRSFMKNKLGQAPVYMSDIDAEQIAQVLEAHLINNGFFGSEVTSEVRIKEKKGEVTYTARVQRPYRIRDIGFPKMDTLFTNIDSVKNDSYVKTGQRYNLERLQAEQARIEAALENLGFFYFDDRHLIFEADSTVGERQVDLTLTLERGVPEKAKRIYRLGKINIYPDYTLSPDTVTVPADTTLVDGYHYIDRHDNYRPQTITKVINFRPGNIYRDIDREFTLRHLMSLGSFKFVDIRFTESQRDSFLLDTDIYLTPHFRKSIRGELQMVSKSNNFVGPGFSVRFTNRNFLRGSEQFTITANTSYEVQVGRNLPNPLNSFEFGVESGLSIPRILSPLKIHYPSRRYLPTTELNLGFRLQQRIGFFHLNSFNLAAGYVWRENTLKTHELYPIDISFVSLGKTSKEFDALLTRNPLLRGSFQDQFIPGSRYSYTLNTQVNEERQSEFKERPFERSQFFFNGNMDIAGNLVNFLQRSFTSAEGDSSRIFGTPYSQFVKGDIDFRYYLSFDQKNRLVTRLIFGTGYAYGNSTILPYIKQFSIGGSNSIRAFPARTVGPGTFDLRVLYPPEDPEEDPQRNTRQFIDQRGDIKLEGNIEYRFNIVGFLNGAVFVDAGNIWLMREDPDRPGGRFNKDDFLTELAVGTGAGLRFDFNFFVLRFDLAFPLRKPYLPENERWIFDTIDFGSPSWRSDNLILNIAIGYPF
ncbi:MAG TPA: BamA/TamA family outer membrane protein [Chryseosolibacter sp.]|nr:BamA/TamA family outer membrane protein [Chryseosolibacter sp.]